MSKIKQQFIESTRQLKNPKVMTITAMFIAIGVVLGFVTNIQITEFIRVGFSFLPNHFVSMMFGPVVGSVMGGITDLLKYIVRPTGPFFIGFTLNAIVEGIIVGLVLYKRPLTFKRVLIANILIAVVVNILMTTCWLSILYSKGFFVILSTRIVKHLITVPIDSIVFYAIAKPLSNTKVIKPFLKEN